MDYRECCKIFGIRDINSLPSRINEILFGDIEQRDAVFRALLDSNHYDVSHDWFQGLYEAELSEGKRKGQHFTPQSIYALIPELVGSSGKTVHEPTAGTGGLIIGDWWNWCKNRYPWEAAPSNRRYCCWELSDRSVPILLLNLAVRGIMAEVFHGDVLENRIIQKYIVINRSNNFVGFSDVVKVDINSKIKEL